MLRLFGRTQPHTPHFGQGLLAILVIIFAYIARYKAVVGLSGLGVTLIIAAVLVELNRERIWDEYRKSYKRRKRKSTWSAPAPVYYYLNVWLLWPLVGALGLVSVWAAYLLS